MTRQPRHDALLTLNAGSSSIKFAFMDAARPERRLARGIVESIGEAPTVKSSGALFAEAPLPALPPRAADHASLVAWLLTAIRERLPLDLLAAGHRVVHGGDRFAGPAAVTADVLAAIEALVPLARLHQPHNLAAIRAVAALWPDLPQIACFDTAFHRTQPAVAQSLALPAEWGERGLRRYGFHGLAFEHLAHVLPRLVGARRARGRVVACHLGNGASLCALRDLASVATTMGLTPLDGLVMGTRPGLLDPGLVLHLLGERGMSLDEVSHLLHHESGLKGVSGISADIRVLLAHPGPAARFALDLFCYRVRREIGSLAAALQGLDILIFSGGIGEHAAEIRASVLEGLGWLGVELDADANRRHDGRITRAGSAVEALIVPADEEATIARAAAGLLRDRGA